MAAAAHDNNAVDDWEHRAEVLATEPPAALSRESIW